MTAVKKIIALLLAAALLMSACGADPKKEKTEVKLVHATDMHYISQQLTDNSEAFVQMVTEGDGKVTHYSEQVCSAFVQQIIAEKPDAVLIGGDISFNCEKISHQDFISKLKEIEKAGIDVLTIPGNHDVEYPFSYSYSGNTRKKTEYTAEADFAELYKEFGPDIAYTKSPDGLSYIAQLGKDIYVAALYTPQSFMPSATVAQPEMLEWLDKELAKLDKNAKVITLTHQSVVSHFDGDSFRAKYSILNGDELIKIYEKYGVDLNLSGHIHLQSIAETDSGIADIATASMTVCGCHYGVIDVAPDKISYSTTPVDVESWAAQNGVTDENLLNFSSYSKEFYYDSAFLRAMGGLEDAKLTAEEKALVADVWARFNTNYFSGTLNEYYPQLLQSEGYKIIENYDMDDIRSINYLKNAIKDEATQKNQNIWEKTFAPAE